MTALPTRSKDTIVASMAAAVQGRVPKFLNFAIGSVFLAISEAVAGVALWLQAEILGVLKTTRAATSEGDDLKSWIADYGMEPLPAAKATGSVTFARFTAGPTTVVIPLGATVQTGDGSQRFEVYADTQNPNWHGPSNGYRLVAGEGSISVPVRALAAGTDANVGAGAISLLATSIPGVDTVSNPVGFTNGEDEESDDSIRARIPLYFASLAKATETAIRKAITDLGLNLEVSFIHRDPALGQPYTIVVVDDGSGAPPEDLVQRASAAVAGVRAAGVWIPVIGATGLGATILMQIETARGYVHADVVAAVSARVTEYVNGLQSGQKLPWAKLAAVAFAASPGVENVTNVTLNGGRADLIPPEGRSVTLTSLVVS